MPSEWASDARVDREKIDRARKNAEDLFKPRPQPRPVDTVAPAENSVPSTESQPLRQPRIFRVLPAVPMKAAEVETPAQPKPTRLRRTVRRETGTIPGSQFGRIRTLTSYGMTQAQVAELYGVSVDEIERSLIGKNYRASIWGPSCTKRHSGAYLSRCATESGYRPQGAATADIAEVDLQRKDLRSVGRDVQKGHA